MPPSGLRREGREKPERRTAAEVPQGRRHRGAAPAGVARPHYAAASSLNAAPLTGHLFIRVACHLY